MSVNSIDWIPTFLAINKSITECGKRWTDYWQNDNIFLMCLISVNTTIKHEDIDQHLHDCLSVLAIDIWIAHF